MKKNTRYIAKTLPFEEMLITKNIKANIKYLNFLELRKDSSEKISHGRSANDKISGLKIILCIIESGRKFKNIRVHNIALVL